MNRVIRQEIKFPERLAALADHIETIPQDLFNMASFRVGSKDGERYVPRDETLHGCGSVGCIIGHSPKMLIEKFGLTIPIHKPTGNIDWPSLSYNLLGLSVANIMWEYLFGGGWAATDNTPIGAAKRIRWVLAHGGVPADHKDQRMGFTKLSYMEEGQDEQQTDSEADTNVETAGKQEPTDRQG